MHSAEMCHDIRSMFQSDRGIKIQTGAGKVLCFLYPSCGNLNSLFSLAGTALVPLSCHHHLSFLGLRHAGLWSDSPCWEASPPVDLHSYVADWPGQHCPCPRPLGHSHTLSILSESMNQLKIPWNYIPIYTVLYLQEYTSIFDRTLCYEFTKCTVPILSSNHKMCT